MMTNSRFKELSSSDKQQYYQNTYLPAKIPGVKDFQWVQLVDIGAGQARLVLPEGKVVLVDLDNTEFDFEIPPAGLYNFRNSVICFQRYPLRSPSKGLNQNNSFFHNLISPAVKAGIIPIKFYNANAFQLTPQALQHLFKESNNPSFEKGIDKIVKKQALAYALNGRIGLSQGIYSKNPTIWLKTRVIGELDLNKEKIFALREEFIPELLISFANTGFQVEQ